MEPTTGLIVGLRIPGDSASEKRMVRRLVYFYGKAEETYRKPMGNLWEIDISTVMAIKIG